MALDVEFDLVDPAGGRSVGEGRQGSINADTRMSGLFRAPADVVKPRIAAATLKAAGIADKKRINESGIKQTVATFDVKLKSAPSADSGAVLAPRGCVTNLSRTLLRLLLLLACSPLQIIQCQRPEFFGDARRAALTCKQCAPLG